MRAEPGPVAFGSSFCMPSAALIPFCPVPYLSAGGMKRLKLVSCCNSENKFSVQEIAICTIILFLFK